MNCPKVHHCSHTRVWDEVRPGMGSFPSSWTCNDCNTTVPIEWIPTPLKTRGDNGPSPEGEELPRHQCSRCTSDAPCVDPGYTRKEIDDRFLEHAQHVDKIVRHEHQEEREWRKALLDSLGKFFVAYKQTDHGVEKGWVFHLDDLRKRFT